MSMQSRRRRFVSAVCGLLVALGLSASALAANAAAATWNVAYPPYSNPNGGVPYAPLLGIGAITPSDVWAVGEVSGSPLTESWNGSKWATSPIPGSPEGAENLLTALACTSSSSCMAVGYAQSSSFTGGATIAERWNGSRCEVVSTPAP